MASSYSKKDKSASEKKKKIADIQTGYSSYGTQASNESQAAFQSGLESTVTQRATEEFNRTKHIGIRAIAGIEVPEDVRSFAAKNDLFSHLETAIQLVCECFPSVNTVKLEHEIDWENENESWIAINIDVSSEVDVVLQQYMLFNRLMIRQIPPLKCNLILLGINSLKNGNKI